MSPQKIWSREEFLDLLDDDDVAALWERWALPPSATKRRDALEFVAAVDTRSKTTLVQDVLALHTATLQMLTDVLTFLTDQSAAARTTGSHLVLNEEIELTPQQVEAALKWSERALRRHSTETWEALRERFRNEIVALVKKIEAHGKVDTQWEQEDIVDVAIRHFTGGDPQIHETTTVEYDEDGFRVREEYIQKLTTFSEQLRQLNEEAAPEAASLLARDIRNLARAAQMALQRSRYQISNADRVRDWSSYHDKLIDADHETWKRFAEDVLFLSDIEAGASVVDVLRLDLFRKRPQLYELWIVVTVINFLRRRGHDVELLNMITTDDGRLQWNLNYAKSSRPVAKLTRRRDGTASFLFYQLFRAGTARDDMPDVALLPSERPGDRPIWIMDPKHSERRGYSLRDYEDVARRYHDTFQPLRTWIVEYYPRENRTFADGVELITDVAPGRPGLTTLLSRLAEVHGTPSTTMAIIDVSTSFAGNLGRVRADIAARAATGEPLADEVIWFSDDAAVGLAAATPSIASGGTLFAPVVKILERLRNEGTAPSKLLIYTDRGFTDVELERALADFDFEVVG